MSKDDKGISHRKLKNKVRAAIKKGDATHQYVLEDIQKPIGQYLFEVFREQVLASQEKRKAKAQ